MLCGVWGVPRRDFTVNSMFYNINTRQVEDWTRRGLEDLLQHKVIRTPLPARDTFQDGVRSAPAASTLAERPGWPLRPDCANRPAARHLLGESLIGV